MREAGLTGLCTRPRTQGGREPSERRWNQALGVKHLSHPGCWPPAEGVLAGAGQVPRGSLHNLLPLLPLLKRPGALKPRTVPHQPHLHTASGQVSPATQEEQSIPKGNPQRWQKMKVRLHGLIMQPPRPEDGYLNASSLCRRPGPATVASLGLAILGATLLHSAAFCKSTG